MNIRNNRYLNYWVILFCILMPVVIALALMPKESPMIMTEEDKIKTEG